MPRRPKTAVPAEAESHGGRGAGTEATPVAEQELEHGRRADLLVDTLYLPTLILPQTLLLPHMSLPYPLDEGEETQAVDHAIRADRLILVLATTDQSDDGDDDED